LSRRFPVVFPRYILVAAAGLLVCALGARLAGQAAAPLTIFARDGRRQLPVQLVNKQEYVALDDLAAAFQLTVREEAGAITVSARGRTIILTPDQALASAGGRLISLPAPPARAGSRWLVPIEFINRAMTSVYDGRLELRRQSRLLLVGDVRVPRVTMRFEPMTNAARLTIDAAPRAASTVSQDGTRLTIAFEADLLDVTVPAIQPQGIVQGIRVPDATTLGVELGPRFNAFRATSQTLDNSSRLVIDFVGAVETTAAPPAAPPPPAPASDLPPLSPPVPALRTIAIDPGHGGEDAGARGPGGSLEKDLTLAVARRLKATIEGRLGIRVLMTRDDDRAVPLDQRTSLANNNKADLFISLHANGSPRPAKTGASIYVASFPDGGAAQVAASERVAVFGGGSREIELVPWDLAQIRFVDQSSNLAALLQQELQERVPLDARPVTRAPFRVLESANMPAILVEMGYLTNEGQEKQLADGSFQAAIVQAIFDAVMKFRGHLAAAGEGAAQ
jgi:N-acetylmuramoyl-L-alanine amidase